MKLARRRPATGPLDVVALGALNVDLIVVGQDADGDTEKAATPEEVLRLLTRRDVWPEAFLGGSAFNAMVMLAQLGLDLRLGMAGVAAPATYGMRETHAGRLEKLGIRDLTWRSDGRAGLCVAYANGHRRQLLTSPAANLEIVDHLPTAEDLRAEVAQAKVLHLTSLLEDPTDPGSRRVAEAAADFVQSVKTRDLKLSFDPGAAWVAGADDRPELSQIYKLTDVLFVNPRERAYLERRRLLGDATIVEKTADSVIVRAPDKPAVAVRRDDLGATPVDPTGAGDAVAAGVLAALGEGHSIADGCRLGLRIAGHRVRDVGDRGHAELKRSIGRIWR